jgi:xanthine dehydrogenase iron-sulfur cluster and FAD-binding subunit A
MTATEGPDAAGAPPARRLTCTVNGRHHTVELDGHIIAGNLCRCTGYQRIVTSIRDAAARSRASGS